MPFSLGLTFKWFSSIKCWFIGFYGLSVGGVITMKGKYVDAFMRMAVEFAKTSEAERLKVCCLIVKNDQVISIGINGTIKGWHTNKCEDESGATAWYVKHAEIQALNKLRKSSESSSGATMFVTHSPCMGCVLDILDAEISKVYYLNQYRDSSGIDFLRSHGVEVEQVTLT